MAQHGQTNEARAGQRVALFMAGVGVFWVLVTMIGAEYGWSMRTRAFFDLAALAGFGFALWQTFRLWRARQDEKGDE
ncbi:DUF5337 domain-containing protein [Loktanella sp. Alg231-35]|uniref:DUF5337 domain-containing protein n=1 Tax=Loktanella sp. Alg231-35 TaxID=1922220 RepID=UPI000D559D6F|nr:DUF5337 domain-containing protein [Loktanella sp. Alg231-35]